MDSGPENDVFDLFGLENDKDIDFETAYKMISKFDEEISLLTMDLRSRNWMLQSTRV